MSEEQATLTTAQISLAMRNRWPLSGGYAMIEEVGNATGARCSRHADAIVMSTWPSRGMEIMGFEYKASRADWVKELKSPEKAEPIFQFCDRGTDPLDAPNAFHTQKSPQSHPRRLTHRRYGVSSVYTSARRIAGGGGPKGQE